MAWPVALALMLGLVCLAMLIGLPVAFAFFLTNIVGAIVFLGGGPLMRHVFWRPAVVLASRCRGCRR